MPTSILGLRRGLEEDEDTRKRMGREDRRRGEEEDRIGRGEGDEESIEQKKIEE